MTDHTTIGPVPEPDHDSGGAAVDLDAAFRSHQAPITEVPQAAADYAHLRKPEPPELESPIQLSEVPDAASTAYVPEATYGDVADIPALPEEPEPGLPINDVPLDLPTSPVTPDEVIADVPFALPEPVSSAEVGPLISEVPAQPESPFQGPGTPAAAEPDAETPRTPWWKLLLGR